MLQQLILLQPVRQQINSLFQPPGWELVQVTRQHTTQLSLLHRELVPYPCPRFLCNLRQLPYQSLQNHMYVRVLCPNWWVVANGMQTLLSRQSRGIQLQACTELFVLHTVEYTVPNVYRRLYPTQRSLPDSTQLQCDTSMSYRVVLQERRLQALHESACWVLVRVRLKFIELSHQGRVFKLYTRWLQDASGNCIVPVYTVPPKHDQYCAGPDSPQGCSTNPLDIGNMQHPCNWGIQANGMPVVSCANCIIGKGKYQQCMTDYTLISRICAHTLDGYKGNDDEEGGSKWCSEGLGSRLGRQYQDCSHLTIAMECKCAEYTIQEHCNKYAEGAAKYVSRALYQRINSANVALLICLIIALAKCVKTSATSLALRLTSTIVEQVKIAPPVANSIRAMGARMGIF
uniref:Uncharacterized protein n=1 Tax=Spironucleus salmonicida TaxID=348837 RepID=V6LFR6_9EUKA|eukprot:EST43133.1 Hypothetical protein SS50377_17218 [Spironucleus salmonicida]